MGLSIASDGTERKRLEAAVRHLAAIVESSDDAIISKDLNGTITSWNRGAERIFGYTAAEAVGRQVSMLAAPDRLDEIPDILSKVRRGERVDHFETQRRRKDGQIIDVALTVSPVRDAAGKIIGASKIARDISERKALERERALSLAREREARRIAELLNAASARLASQLDREKLLQEVTDIATGLVAAEFGAFFGSAVNDKGESYTLCTVSGVPREALAGFRYGKMSPCLHAPDGDRPVRSYLAAPVVARSGEVLGGLILGHSQPDKFTETHAAVIKGIAAQAAIAMDNARLFDQAQWVQEELRRSNEELRRANRDLEIFAYSASHDMQEPLRTIVITAQLLERSSGSQLNADDSGRLDNIISAGKRMTSLIADLMAYSMVMKTEEGPAPRVDSNRVLAEVLKSLEVRIREARADVRAGPLPHVTIHEIRLAQIFQNLLSNALKYRSQEEVPRVEISAGEQDGWYVFSVADNGIGIEPQFTEQIFGLFKRLHSRDEYPGSGIGLAICQRIVEQYGGRIWVERSAPGRGSIFCFTLPSRC